MNVGITVLDELQRSSIRLSFACPMLEKSHQTAPVPTIGIVRTKHFGTGSKVQHHGQAFVLRGLISSMGPQCGNRPMKYLIFPLTGMLSV